MLEKYFWNILVFVSNLRILQIWKFHQNRRVRLKMSFSHWIKLAIWYKKDFLQFKTLSQIIYCFFVCRRHDFLRFLDQWISRNNSKRKSILLHPCNSLVTENNATQNIRFQRDFVFLRVHSVFSRPCFYFEGSSNLFLYRLEWNFTLYFRRRPSWTLWIFEEVKQLFATLELFHLKARWGNSGWFHLDFTMNLTFNIIIFRFVLCTT